MADDHDRTAAFMTPAKLAQLQAGKPAAAPAPAWLDQMAADTGKAQVARLAELRDALAAQAPQQDNGAFLAALQQVARPLGQVDFGLLQPKGWLARATGKARSAGAEFAGQYEAVVEAATALKDQALALHKRAQADAFATERTLVEMNVECSAIEKLLEQGARWLQDMQHQLKERRAAAPDEAAHKQIREDAAHCESLLERLKLLRGMAADTRQVLAQARDASAQRTALAHGAQQLLVTHYKAWEGRLAPLAGSAGDSGSPALSQEGALEAQKELQAHLAQAGAGCIQLEALQTSLAERLDALGAKLRSAT